MKQSFAVLLCICSFVLLTKSAKAQQFDAAFGIGTVSTSSENNVANAATLAGGAFPAFSADYLFGHALGVQGEVAWRGKASIYQGVQPYRPIFYDFNGIWAPTFKNRVDIEAMGGIGGLNTRIYQQYYNCSFTGCTNYTSSSHLAGHIGGGIKLYVKGPFFVRPEAHIYFIRNNEEFGQPRATRYGISVGYTMRNEVP